MDYIQAVVLGVVQGLGEFLPISSSGHLILVPYLFHWSGSFEVFDVALHWGTLVALFVYFWNDFWRLLSAGLRQGVRTDDGKLFWMIILASIPAGIVGALFEHYIDSVLHSAILVIAFALGLMGLVLWYVDKLAQKKRSIETLNYFESFVIGCSQALALLPGVSRSGATITTGLLFGLTREAAARFSFFMSAPVILGAGLLKLRDLHASDITGPFVVGVVTAAVVGYLSIGFLLRYIRHGNYAVFAWYRLAAAALVIIVVLLRNG